MKRLKFDSTDILPIACGALVGVTLLQTITIAVLGVSYQRLAKRDMVLVQQSDGSGVLARTTDAKYREPKFVQEFVKDWLTLTFNWSGKLDKDTPDQGMPISNPKGKNFKAPTNLWRGSFYFPPDKRLPFLLGLHEQEWIPDTLYSATPTRTVIEVDFLSEPELIDRKRFIWQVQVVSTISYFLPGQTMAKTRYYNRAITLSPIPVQRSLISETASAQEQLIYHLRSRGLQITDIQPIEFAR